MFRLGIIKCIAKLCENILNSSFEHSETVKVFTTNLTTNLQDWARKNPEFFTT